MSDTRRKIEALRNLAERPGTEAEGILAREMLARWESKKSIPVDALDKFSDFLRTGHIDDLAKAVGYKTCDCGNCHPAFTSCPKTQLHQQIDSEKRILFPRGSRVFYNRWAYRKNCPGTITGYSIDWSWMRIKFDHLKNSRAVQIYSQKGWHLSTKPIEDPLVQAGLRGGMENIES